MRRTLSLILTSVVLSTLMAIEAPAVMASKGTLATIAGSVRDNKGNPLAGALVSLLKEGANQLVKQTRTGADGRFSTRVAPGRYGIRAMADGFSEVVFSSIEVRASAELVYRFNLEPVGSGKTLPERRKDRDDVKWTLRSSQTRRSIFQVQPGENNDIQAVEAEDAVNQPAADDSAGLQENRSRVRTQGVVETYFAGNSSGSSYSGLNFAVLTPATEHIELVFAGQTGLQPQAPERLEATALVRAGERHRIGMSVGGVRFATPIWTSTKNDHADAIEQFSVRAIDEWIVRDGIVIVLGLDYSRFIGNGGAHSLTPRFGIQFDANARTRLKAAYAPGGEEGRTQSVAEFENTQVAFTEANNRPVAFIDGQAIMERSHRLEFGLERILDNSSSLETTAFFDTTTGRGVGLLSTPISAFSGTPGDRLINVANQQGASRGMRVVYTRRLSRVWTGSAGYSFGRGQRLSPAGFSNPASIFANDFFHTVALQFTAGFKTGTHIRTVLRFSPDATVFAIDPFAGRLGVYDPSLSIQVTQDLPSFGLPVRAEAVIDGRNLLDAQASTENGEILTQLSNGRSVRGGISVRF